MPLGSNTKSYETPNHPFQGERIAEEHDLLARYGLKNKEELWRAQSELRSFRREARALLGQQGGTDENPEEVDQFLGRLKRLGILDEADALDDILSLDVTDVLERRLQTVVYRQGLANTPKQARQFVIHGHVRVGDRRVSIPSYKVEVDEADFVDFDGNSPIADDLHPARAGDNE